MASAGGLTGEAVDQLEARLGGAPSEQETDALLAAYRTEQLDVAETLARALTRKFPNHDFGWKVLGAVFSVTGRLQGALDPMRQAIRLAPDDAEAHKNLGIALINLKQSEAGVEACRAAIRLRPDYAQALLHLGNGLVDLDRFAEAESAYREAVRVNPDYAEAHSNLGNALKMQARLTEAEASYRAAIALKPDYAHALNNLGDVLKDVGRLTEAQAFYREAIRLEPGYTAAHSNLLFCLNYVETLPPQAALAEAKAYGAAVSARARPKFTAWRGNPDPARLRVGFVSGDLINHPVGYFAEGLVRHLDPNRFALLAFPTTAKEDDLTRRIRPLFQGWQPLFGKTDRDAATLIHQQGVDVLIDLSGHTAHNRLPVLAYKPAPVQATWLGYFATTGLPEMDYILGDPHMSPTCEASHFTEMAWTLPRTWLCLTPPEQPVPIAPAPALANGFVTLGCLGNLSKVNDEVVGLWARVLRRIPNARLLLKAKQLADAEVVARVRARFAGHDIAADRLILEGPASRAGYFEAYNRLDLVLDTFPYPGGTTSVDALWMGVPVLTLKGDRFLSHLGETIAHNAGQADWIARDHADYVEKAAAFAASPAHDRAALRDQVLKTPLFDTRRFAEGFGEALWGMWRAGPKAGT